jgi:YidC/Oxa1 family membrane protein insertase
MEKRIFSAVLISIALLWAWAALAPKLFPELAKPPRPNTPPAKQASAPATPTTSSAPSRASSPAASLEPPAVSSPTSASRVSLTRIETRDYVATFSNRGAQLVSFKLLNYSTKPKNGEPVELVKSREAVRTDFPFALEARDAAVTSRLNTALYEVNNQVSKDGAGTLEFHYRDGNGLSATKTFRFSREYQFHFAVALSPALPYRVIIGPGIRTLSDEEKEQVAIMSNGAVQREGDLKVVARDKSDRFNILGNVDYVGVEDNYFLSVLKPEKAGGGVLRAWESGTGKQMHRELYAGLNAASDGIVAGSAFFGPKQTSLLDRYGYEHTLQFGTFGIIARFFLVMLEWFYRYTHNWGWAIIILTIIIKVVLYPLQHKWMLSMKKIQRVQPKMEAIKAKYRKQGNDAEARQKMNAEMMKLYQQEGINPAGGCLPMLIQFPIFVGFYNLLSHAIELRGAPFALWIHDLSAKDPTYVLVILMTIAMFIQQKITPTSADPVQRRMFMIMPIAFGIFFKEFASGLVLYWLVQNILTIVQQMITNRYWKDHPDATA